MNSSGFPAILQFARLNSAITSLKTQAEKARVEMVTGRMADPTATLGAGIGAAQLLEKALADIDAYKLATKTALGRASIMQQSLARTTNGASELSVRLLDAVGQGNDQAVGLLREDARAQLDVAIAALNQTYQGRSLFAGDAVDQTPLADADALLADIAALYAGAADAAQFEADLDFYFNDPAGGFATTIYQGGAGDAPRVALSDEDLVAYGAKADEQPVRDLLRSLAAIAVAGGQQPDAERDAILNAAASRLIEASDGVAAIRSRIGVSERRMELALENLEAESTALTLSYNDLIGRDPFESASRLQALETQLEAAFVLSARISQLSLVNFLR